MAHKIEIDYNRNDRFCFDDDDTTTKYLKNALNPGIEQLAVNVVLEGQQLSLELEVPGEAGHCHARAGVAVPPDEGVVGGRLANDVAEDVVHHLCPGLRLHLDLSLLSRGAEGRGCGGGGGGQSGQPLAVPTHAHLVVGRTEGGGYVGLSGVVVNAGHAPHHVTPDVGAVAGEEASHQTKVLCALKQ